VTNKIPATIMIAPMIIIAVQPQGLENGSDSPNPRIPMKSSKKPMIKKAVNALTLLSAISVKSLSHCF
jgi:hypothetical protein